MTKAYILIYDADNGSREYCNILYSPVEVFADAETRAKRIEYIESNTSYQVGFRLEEIDLMTSHEFEIPEHLLSDIDDHQVIDEDQASMNPQDYYFYVFEGEDPFDLEEDPAMVTVVTVTLAKYFDETGNAWDQSVPLEMNDCFVEVGECEYEYEGTVEQARADMIAMGFRESVAYSRMIQNYLDDPDD